MVFNSGVFLAFFIVFFPLYWWVSHKHSLTLRNALLLAGSYLFYGWWDWRFLGLLLFSSTMDYVVGLQLHKILHEPSRKRWLWLSVVINVSLLGFFKYFNFFIGSFSDLMQLLNIPVSLPVLKIVLPVGISFYTFQSLSYTIEIYRRRMEPTRNYLTILAYVSFFPQLVAGPIERAWHLLPQFSQIKKFRYVDAVQGLQLMLWGFFKKVVIADNLALVADMIFEPGAHHHGFTVLTGALCFTFQIYADFSGYSDIARGVAKLLGFDLMINFQSPYFSTSLTEFWHRWHISLSTWFRDYVFIPLGGSRTGEARTYRNLMLTFLISGIWHGANFTFALWGFAHGLLLCIEKALGIKNRNKIYIPLVLLVVCILWIPFRATGIAHTMELLKQAASFTYSAEELFGVFAHAFPVIKGCSFLVVFVLFMLLDYVLYSQELQTYLAKQKTVFRYLMYYAMLLSILLLSNLHVKPYFIYFQF